MILSCLKKGLKGWSLSNFKIINYYWQFNRADLEKELQQFLKKNSISRENIILGVPRDKVIVRFLELPREVEENLKEVIRYQVESLTPVEDETPYYDFVVVNKHSESPKLKVLLVLVKRAILDKYLNFLSEVKIFPNVVQISSVALYNLFLSRGNHLSLDTYLLFDLNEGNLELLAVRDKQLLYSKFIKLQDTSPSVDLLLGEMETALSNLSLDDGQIENVFFSGKSTETVFDEFKARIKDSKLLSDNFPQEVNSHLQPFLLNNLTTSMGLALGTLTRKPPIAINLLPEEKRVKFKRISYIPTLVLLALIVILLVALSIREFLQERTLLTKLDREISALKPKVEEVRGIRKDIEAVEQKVRFIENIIDKQDNVLELLKDLTVKMPDNSFLQNLTVSNKGEISLGGLSGTPATSLVQTIEKSPYLEKVELSSSYKDPASGKERFAIKAKIKEK